MSETNPTEVKLETQGALHSPVPWSWKPCETDGPLADDEPISGAQLIRPDGRSVFSIDCGDYQGLSNADAEFIVRAVNAHNDLLAALRLFTDRYVKMVNSGDCGNWNPETEDHVIAARAAIAKAEGR